MPNDATSLPLLADGKAVGEGVIAFILALGFQLRPKATCRGGRGLTCHSPDVRVRLGALTIWRLQCTTGRAMFTILPHVVVRERQMHPEVAREALWATPGGLRLARWAVISQIWPRALERRVCTRGHHRLVRVLTRGGLPLPTDCWADEPPRHGLPAHVDWPTSVRGRVLWPLGSTKDARAAALTPSDGALQRVGCQQEPSYRVQGGLTDGFDSPTKRMPTRLPRARLGHCLRHALTKLPTTLTASASPVRTGWRSPFHTLWSRARQRTGVRVCALGQRVRRVADHVATTAGAAHGQRGRHWLQDKQAGWSLVLADPQRPVTSTLLDQAHHAIDRKVFMMKGFHHPTGSPQAYLRGRAPLYTLVPSHRRAQHAGPCGVEVEGGTVPTREWCLNRPILTSGGISMRGDTRHH